MSPILKMEISKIRAMDIQDIIIDLSYDYSQSVLKEIKSTASQILQLAVDNRVMDYNPAQAVKIPNKTSDNNGLERRALTIDEQHWINDTPHRAKTAAMIMMYAGLRRGELIPLLWTDINLDAGTISVTKSVKRVKSKLILKDGAKSEASVRTVFIPKILVEYLSSIDKSTNMLVCPSSKGKRMDLSAWDRLWESYLAELNFNFGDFSGIMVKNKKTEELEEFKKPI